MRWYIYLQFLHRIRPALPEFFVAWVMAMAVQGNVCGRLCFTSNVVLLDIALPTHLLAGPFCCRLVLSLFGRFIDRTQTLSTRLFWIVPFKARALGCFPSLPVLVVVPYFRMSTAYLVG